MSLFRKKPSNPTSPIKPRLWRALWPRREPWREVAIARLIAAYGLERRFATQTPDPLAETIETHLEAASQAIDCTGVKAWRRPLSWVQGADVDRATGNLDAADVFLLRIAPDDYVIGRLPAMQAKVRAHLRAGDPQLEAFQKLVARYAAPPASARLSRRAPVWTLDPAHRETIAAVYDAGCAEGRREVARLRSFRNVLLATAMTLWVAVAALTIITTSSRTLIPMCFMPNGTAVCPLGAGPRHPDRFTAEQRTVAAGDAKAGGLTEVRREELRDRIERDATDALDVALVELVGGLAALVAAAVELRNVRGTSTPYSLPLSLAFLKVPTGALTAVLGILLLRGEFIPGLSALDSSGQILAWAAAFGAAQQLVTRLVDRQANELLEKVGTPGTTKAPDGTTVTADTP